MNVDDSALFPYDEEASVKYIREHLPAEISESIVDDDIVYIVDMMYEYYDSKGFLEGNDDDEVEIDVEELTAGVLKMAKADDIKAFTEEQVEAIIEAELGYCDTLDLFEDDID